LASALHTQICRGIFTVPGFIEKLLTEGCIEKSIIDGHLCYRITDQGLAAKKVPI